MCDVASTMFPPVVKTPDYREPEKSGIIQVLFTRDRTKVYPDENSSLLLRLHSSANKCVHLTFPFTWVLPESIRKAAFRIPTAEIVVHRSTDSNMHAGVYNILFPLWSTKKKRRFALYTVPDEYLTGTYRNSSAFVGGRKFERIRVENLSG